MGQENNSLESKGDGTIAHRFRCPDTPRLKQVQNYSSH